ncbi:MAG: EAL domain-containing protein [Planctomycetaceae bacterium]
MLDFSAYTKSVPPSGVEEGARVWSLVRRSANGEDEHRTEISAGKVTIGRRPNNSLCITHQTVSGHHAELSVQGATLKLTDLQSTNGTLVNGRRITGSVNVNDGDVVHFGQVVFVIEEKVPRGSQSGLFANKTFVAAAPEDAILYEGFDRLLNAPDIDPHFQPIVQLGTNDIVGYEVLVRSQIKGLEYPDKIFRIAAMRMSEAKLSEVCRSEGLLAGLQMDPHADYFLNTHAVELETPRLLESLKELRNDFPQMKITLEVHEGAITSVSYLQQLYARLKDLDIQLAYDDFGAGQARLIELFEVPPKYLKFDLQIIRGLETASPLHRASVRALVNMVHDLNVLALAEGVETENQAAVCREVGFDMAQGYYFGRPQPRQFWQKTIVSVPTEQIPVIPADI